MKNEFEHDGSEADDSFDSKEPSDQQDPNASSDNEAPRCRDQRNSPEDSREALESPREDSENSISRNEPAEGDSQDPSGEIIDRVEPEINPEDDKNESRDSASNPFQEIAEPGYMNDLQPLWEVSIELINGTSSRPRQRYWRVRIDGRDYDMSFALGQTLSGLRKAADVGGSEDGLAPWTDSDTLCQLIEIKRRQLSNRINRLKDYFKGHSPLCRGHIQNNIALGRYRLFLRVGDGNQSGGR